MVAFDSDVIALAEKRGLNMYDAYLIKRRRILEQSLDSSPLDEIRKIIRKTMTEIADPARFLEKLTEITYSRPKICGKMRDGIYFCYTTAGGLNLRTLSILVEIDNPTELNAVKGVVDEIIREGSIKYGNDEIYYDVMNIVIYSPKNEIDPSIVERTCRGPWKIPRLDRSLFVNVHIVDSSSIEKYRSSIIGGELTKSLKNVPEKYSHYIKYLNDLREKTDSFLKRSSDYILKNLVLAVRRSRSSKSDILREIVDAWIRRDKLIDQPEVWRDSDGTARISMVERLLYHYLKDRGTGKISQRELEKLIRKLFPTFLWKDFKERDLIELCRLRGLLIEVEQGKYVPYSSSIAKSALARKLEEIKRVEKSSKRRVDINIGPHKTSIEVQMMTSETLASISRVRHLITEIADLGEDEDSVRRFAKIMLNIAEIETDMKREVQNSENILKKIERTLIQINEAYNRVLRYLENIEKSLPRISRRLLRDLESEIDTTMRILSNYDIINAEELYEYIRRIGEKISMLELEYSKIVDVLSKICDVCEKAREVDLEAIEEARKALKSIDMRATRDSSASTDKILRELEKVYTSITSRVGSKLARIHRELDAARRLLRAICLADLAESEVCATDLDDIERVRRMRSRIFETLKNVIGEDLEVALRIAELGDEVPEDALDEEGRRVLERLWRMGLVRRIYRFVT